MQAGIPSAIPVEACYLGWQESLTLLTQLVEAKLPTPASDPLRQVRTHLLPTHLAR